jgi:myo-inositol-1(or 4)-monophosphatase
LPDAEDRQLAALLDDAAQAAAVMALDFVARGFRRWTKAGASPVTEADIAIDRFLRERLTAARPAFGWLSEETTDDPHRLSCREVFVVDPIDGTRAFADGLPDWTISIAVVRDERPVAAALAEPVAKRRFTAAAGSGAFLNGQPIAPSARDGVTGARLAGPRPLTEAHGRAGAVLLPKVHSLALRFAKVAAGEVDAAFSSGDSHDWDLAAADLLVHEAGASLTDLDGKAPVYNRPRPVHPALIAAGGPLRAALLARSSRQG